MRPTAIVTQGGLMDAAPASGGQEPPYQSQKNPLDIAHFYQLVSSSNLNLAAADLQNENVVTVENRLGQAAFF